MRGEGSGEEGRRDAGREGGRVRGEREGDRQNAISGENKKQKISNIYTELSEVE